MMAGDLACVRYDGVSILPHGSGHAVECRLGDIIIIIATPRNIGQARVAEVMWNGMLGYVHQGSITVVRN